MRCLRLIAGLVLGVTMTSCSPSEQSTLSQPQTVTAPGPSLEPVSFYPGLLWNRTGREGEAPFEIKSSAGTNHILKLVDFTTGRDAIAVLVRGGQTLEISVPVGSYRMKWCSGSTWYGERHRFGPDESCSTTRDLFRFSNTDTYVEGHTVTLYRVADGNMSTQKLAPSAF